MNLSDLSTSQLLAFKQIIVAGVQSQADAEFSEFAQDRERLCHKSPPKGYPKEKSQYGDSECYRYPLNTKARCLAAWSYVHHVDNKALLGKKFKGVESKIKTYAKKNYDLDLQVGGSEEFNWAQAFMEYYDSENMGERCECIVLEPDNSEEAKNKMDIDEKVETLEKEVTDLKSERDTLAAKISDLEGKASQVDTFTQELNDQKDELENLRKFKSDTEEAAEKAERIKNIKSMLEAADVKADVDAEVDYWLGMSDEVLKLTISKMGELSKGAKASASIEVPQLPNDETNMVETIREGLREMKSGK